MLFGHDYDQAPDYINAPQLCRTPAKFFSCPGTVYALLRKCFHTRYSLNVLKNNTFLNWHPVGYSSGISRKNKKPGQYIFHFKTQRYAQS